MCLKPNKAELFESSFLWGINLTPFVSIKLFPTTTGIMRKKGLMYNLVGAILMLNILAMIIYMVIVLIFVRR